MAMNKNGMKNTSFKREGVKTNSVPAYNLAKLLQYCKAKGISIEDLTSEELAKFEV